ncbi:MAG: IS21 family transposase, partial [Nitriliruptoraceae bacterium]
MKSAGEIMEILEAYDLVGTYRGAARLAGCDHHTVQHYVERRDAAADPAAAMPRSSVIDDYRPKIEELVERSEGDIRGDVVHERLVAMGFEGTDRTTRRAVAEAKGHFAVGRRRVFRPWITEPGGWLQFDWGTGPSIAGRATLLFCAWLAWSRFRVVIPVWDRTLPTALSCLDETFRRLEGIPTYTLTDNEKTVTAEHVAGVPVRHPDMAAAGRHYGTQIVTCVPADPESKGGSEATVRIAKADLVPTTANLRDDYHSFGELRAETAVFCDTVNTRPHRETGRAPIDMLAEEQARLHPVPRDPYVAALGETRVVSRSSVISLGGVRYSVPHQLIDQQVFVRVDGDEVIVAHQARDGVREVARHLVSTPGCPRLDLSHYPPRSASKILDHKPEPRTPGEAAFLALGPGAAAWLTNAAAAGTARVRMKMNQAVEFAAVYGEQEVDAALAAAAEAGRFAEKDLASILRHRRRVES